MEYPHIILASASPRRIEMFQNHGVTPTILPADIEESLPAGISAKDGVLFLALKKGLHIERALMVQANSSIISKPNTPAQQFDAPNVIVSADTVVFLDQILGKPEHEEDAFRMLKSMKARTHYVLTGVCLIAAGQNRKRVFYETTEVVFNDYSDQEIQDYIATGEPMDKAGAYAIQGGWADHVDHFIGDYNNIVGFPWTRFEEELKMMEQDLRVLR